MAVSNSSSMLLLCRAVATVAKHAEVAVSSQKKAGTGHPKKNNLFDVAKKLQGWGTGHKFAKTHWQPQTYYKLYDIKLGKKKVNDPAEKIKHVIERIKNDGGHGAAWGIYHEEGVEAGKLQKISGANKRCWKCVEDVSERTWNL